MSLSLFSSLQLTTTIPTTPNQLPPPQHHISLSLSLSPTHSHHPIAPCLSLFFLSSTHNHHTHNLKAINNTTIPHLSLFCLSSTYSHHTHNPKSITTTIDWKPIWNPQTHIKNKISNTNSYETHKSMTQNQPPIDWKATKPNNLNHHCTTTPHPHHHGS